MVTEDFTRARDLSRDLSCHLNTDTGDEILLFPQYDVGPYDELVSDRRSTMNRAGTLFRLVMDQRWRFLVISADALIRRVVPRGRFEDACAPVATGDTIRRDSLIDVLEIGGYNRAPLVEEPGTYAVRGGLLDVFPPYLAMPVRIDLFGDEVTSIRWFDPETQSSENLVEEIWIHPARTSLLPVDRDERAMVSRRIRQIFDEGIISVQNPFKCRKLFLKNLPTHEVSLLHVHEALDASLDGGDLVGQIPPHSPVALLDAQAVDRVDAEVGHAERLARVPDGIVQLDHPVGFKRSKLVDGRPWPLLKICAAIQMVGPAFPS